jgi:ribonuclease P protein component
MTPKPDEVHVDTPSVVIRSLKGDRAFQRLRKGRAGHAKHLSLRVFPTATGDVRVGVVVSRKVGKAVTRNRVRRRIREALLSLLREQGSRVKAHGRPSFEVVIVARPTAADADYAALRRSLQEAMRKAALL